MLARSLLGPRAFSLANDAISLVEVAILIALVGPSLIGVDHEKVLWSPGRLFAYIALPVPIRLLFNGSALWRSPLTGSFLQSILHLASVASFAGFQANVWLPNLPTSVLILITGIASTFYIHREVYQRADLGEVKAPVSFLILISGVLIMIPLGIYAAYLRVATGAG